MVKVVPTEGQPVPVASASRGEDARSSRSMPSKLINQSHHEEGSIPNEDTNTPHRTADGQSPTHPSTGGEARLQKSVGEDDSGRVDPDAPKAEEENSRRISNERRDPDFDTRTPVNNDDSLLSFVDDPSCQHEDSHEKRGNQRPPAVAACTDERSEGERAEDQELVGDTKAETTAQQIVRQNPGDPNGMNQTGDHDEEIVDKVDHRDNDQYHEHPQDIDNNSPFDMNQAVNNASTRREDTDRKSTDARIDGQEDEDEDEDEDGHEDEDEDSAPVDSRFARRGTRMMLTRSSQHEQGASNRGKKHVRKKKMFHVPQTMFMGHPLGSTAADFLERQQQRVRYTSRRKVEVAAMLKLVMEHDPCKSGSPLPDIDVLFPPGSCDEIEGDRYI